MAGAENRAFWLFVFLCTSYQDPKDLAPPVTLNERANIYPLKGKTDAKPMRLPDASGTPVNMLPVPRRISVRLVHDDATCILIAFYKPDSASLLTTGSDL